MESCSQLTVYLVAISVVDSNCLPVVALQAASAKESERLPRNILERRDRGNDND